LLQWKAETGLSDKGFEKLLKIMKKKLPKDNELHDSTYEAKKVLCPLGLEVHKIHACINNCILYRGDDGMSIDQYLSQCDFPTADITYKYRHGSPLVRSEEIPNLPTRMQKLHKWYMEASKEGQNWITLGINDEHYFRGNDDINIEFAELFSYTIMAPSTNLS
jgi:hypothetical protein